MHKNKEALRIDRMKLTDEIDSRYQALERILSSDHRYFLTEGVDLSEAFGQMEKEIVKENLTLCHCSVFENITGIILLFCIFICLFACKDHWQ